ncbi:helix-turn-helix domain-containing protein [Kutzneria sp. NPDC052558]|uniref:helix-turn-helix domain-containing protein n=1 Tax=Kutzneria sp. NPDC052558 TaxID=3364121 RepID=UPI0037C83B75
MGALADRLDRLFRTVRRAGDSEHSYASVAEAIRDQQGVTISHTYIWQLRTGRRDNPSVQHLTALATFFGVPVTYFLDDELAGRIDEQLTLLAMLRAAGVTEIALRSADLSESSREAVADMVTQLWKLEHPDK